MFVWAPSQWPMELAIGGWNGKFVDARVSRIHQSLFVEFPILISVGTVPVARIIVIFIGESNGDTILAECPQFLDESIVQLPCPLSREKSNDLRSAARKFGA